MVEQEHRIGDMVVVTLRATIQGARALEGELMYLVEIKGIGRGYVPAEQVRATNDD